MAEIWTSRTRQRQPTGAVGVNWGNPIVNGLVVLWAPFNPLINLAGKTLNAAITGTQLGYGPSPMFGLRNNIPAAGGGEIKFTLPSNFSNQKFTLLGVGQWVTTVDISYRTGFAAVRGPAGDKNYYIGPDNFAQSSASVSKFAYWGVSGTNTIQSSQTYRNSIRNVIGSFDGTTHAAWDNGSLIGQGAMALPSENLLSMYIGTAFEEPVYASALWNRSLSSGEMASVSTNPWQLFAPERRVSYFFPASGIPTLSAATAVSITSTTATPRVTVTF